LSVSFAVTLFSLTLTRVATFSASAPSAKSWPDIFPSQKAQWDLHITGIPIGDAAHIPSVAVLPGDGHKLGGLSVQNFRVVPHSGNFLDEFKFRRTLVASG